MIKVSEYMPKFYTLEDMTQEDLNKLALERNTFASEIERLNNTVNECSNDILKELKENNHLSYGAALAIRQKLIDFKELKGDSSNE